MSKWLGQQFGKRKQKTKQVWEREFNTDSFIKRAVTDAEQIVASIKMKAQTEAEDKAVRIIDQAKQRADEIRRRAEVAAQKEAEDKAVRIIDQAKQGADEIRRRAEVVAQKEAEDILSALNRKVEVTEAEARQKAQLFLLRAREKIEKEVREEYKQAHSRLLHSLLSTSGEAAPPLETSAPMQIEIEPDIASKEKVEQPVQLQEESKRKTEKLRKAKEAQKRTRKGTTLAAKVGALKEKLTKPIHLKGEVPVSEPAEAIAEELPEQVGKEANLAARESDLEEKVEQPVQLEKEVTVSELGEAIAEPAETITEELPKLHPPEEKPGKEEPVSAPIKLDSQALYDGEVELATTVPVDPVAVSRLYNYLQTTPEIKILYTSGSWDRGTTIAVTLDKPLPLIGMISKIPGIEVTPGLPQKDNFVKGTSSSLLRAERKGVTRIDLTLKER